MPIKQSVYISPQSAPNFRYDFPEITDLFTPNATRINFDTNLHIKSSF